MVIRNELPGGRDRRRSPLDAAALDSLIRVMDRAGSTRISDLGMAATRAWAARVGVT